jgi:hypothetical protein
MTTHRFVRGWIVPIAIAAVAGHLLVPYLLFRRTLSIAAVSVVLLMVAKHAGAALMIWWGRRRR